MSTAPRRQSGAPSGSAEKPPVRCAIYTRKSTEEGLEQEFNSLHAQRESGESFIASMRHEGWTCLPHRYDDGGFTGGNIERPALKQLLADIEAGQIDCVVVYKVDRLSRSLLDFARLMEIFDRKKVTFVSVTQQFNTVHSMGRLTLNILLSFAQFEREIISERTRDKIAAARRKGKWAGGRPVLGYDLQKNRLVTRPDEAERVRAIFELYLQKRSLTVTAAALNERGWTTKRVVSAGGRPWGGLCWDKVRLYKLLTNPVFIGQVQHHGAVYPGEHEAIVPIETWQRVQILLKTHGIRGGSLARNKHGALLRGLLHCKTCACPMGHIFTVRGGRLRYRYYGCYVAQKRGRRACRNSSLPAQQIEDLVVRQVKQRAIGPELLARTAAELTQADLATNAPTDASDIAASLGDFDTLWNTLNGSERERLLAALVDRVDYDAERGSVAIQFATVDRSAEEMENECLTP
jgi:site-specific DNA recombinase